MSFGFESFIESIGSKALMFILILGIILNLVVIATATSGASSQFVGALPSLFGLDWVYSSVRTLSDVIEGVNSVFDFMNPLILGSLASVIVSISLSLLVIVTTGYTSLASFLISISPRSLLPLSGVLSAGLAFIQFTVLFVVAKRLFNTIMSIVSAVRGGTYTPI